MYKSCEIFNSESSMNSFYRNVGDLRSLLEEKHVPDTKEPGRSGPTWAGAKGLCELLYNQIVQRKPNFRTIDLVAWITEMDKIIRIDGRSVGQLNEVIYWCQQHDFWKNNILSPAKLRKQLDKLELQMSDDYHWQKNKLRRRQATPTGKTEKQKYMEQIDAKNQRDNERGHNSN